MTMDAVPKAYGAKKNVQKNCNKDHYAEGFAKIVQL